MSRVIIADVKSHLEDGVLKGHVLAVAGNYVNLFRRAASLYVAGGPAYEGKFANFLRLPHNVVTGDATWKNKWRVLSNLRHLFSVCRGDTVVLQSSAVATAFLGICLFKKRDTRLYMIQYNTDAVSSPLKRFLYRWVRRKIDGIICPEEYIAAAYGRPACLVPDYIYADEHPQSPLPYDERSYDFCMLGLICRDKGMVEAARHLAGSGYRVIIAGSPSEAGVGEELEAVCNRADNIELRLRYLASEEYLDLIRRSRYCILNYSGAYSNHTSGVIFDMLFNGTPVIGSRCKTLQVVEDYGIGRNYAAITDMKPQEVLQADVHAAYLHHMQRYYEAHRAYQQRLLTFLGS